MSWTDSLIMESPNWAIQITVPSLVFHLRNPPHSTDYRIADLSLLRGSTVMVRSNRYALDRVADVGGVVCAACLTYAAGDEGCHLIATTSEPPMPLDQWRELWT